MRKPLRRIPTTIAESTSWAMNDVLVPRHIVTLFSEIDVSPLDEIRRRARDAGRLPPSWSALVIRAAAMTMERNPQANRAVLGPPFFRRLYQFENTDIGVAVEKDLPNLPGQAFAIPIRDPLGRSLEEITGELKALAVCDESSNPDFRRFMRVLRFVPPPFGAWAIRAPHWFPPLWVRFRGCAAWVNAPSKSGSDVVLTTWPWPITFSFGVVKERPWVVAHEVVPRLTMPLLMAFDRRIMGGGPGGRLFAQFADILGKELPSSIAPP